MNEAKSTTETLTTTRVSAESNERSHSMRNGLFCALVIAAAVLITNPVANMPFSDEFSYDKTALEFARTGHIIYNGWATAMLGWLIPWGALFIKRFGFSFNVMRFSMLPIAMATVYLIPPDTAPVRDQFQKCGIRHTGIRAFAYLYALRCKFHDRYTRHVSHLRLSVHVSACSRGTNG